MRCEHDHHYVNLQGSPRSGESLVLVGVTPRRPGDTRPSPITRCVERSLRSRTTRHQEAYEIAVLHLGMDVDFHYLSDGRWAATEAGMKGRAVEQ